MKATILTALVVLLTASTATAGWLGGGGFRDFGFGGRHGHFGGRGFNYEVRLSFGRSHTERIQDRFEVRFDDLMSDYEAGLADITDFYSSDEYFEIVDDTGILTDRYDLFVSGVERSIDRIADFISIANEDHAYYNDLLEGYQANTELSEERIDRIVNRLTRITDRLARKIDLLTETQTALEDHLPTYQSFQSEISTFLADIIAAGSGTTEESVSLASSVGPLAATAEATTTMVSSAALQYELSALPEAAMVVPEPRTILILLLALGALTMLPMRKRRMRST